LRFRLPPRRDAEERILPLINVVFLLVAFFMVAGRLSAPEPLAITPPRSTSEVPAETGAVVVHVDAAGRVALDGTLVTAEALAAALSERSRHPGAPLAVQLEADADAEAAAVVAVLQQLRGAGLERLALVTIPAGAAGED
jgi:biopolymer transport protein ExbD